MPTTIKDIAKALGVNVATVSRALNDKPGVGPELRQRILRKAAEMNYRPHGQARALVTQRMETVGLLFNTETAAFLANPFYGEVLAGVESELQARNYSFMLASLAGLEISNLADFPKFIAEHRVDGVLVVGAVEARVIRLLREAGLPFVIVDYHLPAEALDAVVVDNRGGGRLATEHLLALGHRRIAFVGGGPLDRGNFAERLNGYREALAGAGLEVNPAWIQGGDMESGFQSMSEILDRAAEVTAVVACNDVNALGAMRALAVRGLRVPQDVSVVGFDDIAAAATSWPPLTTVRVDKRALGRTAADRLIQKLESHEPAPPAETVFSTELIVRQSTAPPRGAT